MGLFARGFCALSLTAVFHLAPPAAAQQNSFARAGRPTLSAERLSGVFVSDASLEADGTAEFGGMDIDVSLDTDGTTTTLALFGNGTDAGSAGVPRLAFDYFVIDHLSVGGSLTYSSSSEDREDTTQFGMLPATRVDVEETTTLLSVSPRVGYGMMFNDHVGLWGRAGIAYTRFSSTSEAIQREPDTTTTEDLETTANLWNVVLDAQLVLSPLDHFGLLVGPHLAIPLAGSFEVTNNLTEGNLEGDASLTEYGLSAGLVLWL